MTPSAADLHQRGVRLTNQRRYAEAVPLLERAAAATSDPDLAARIAGTLAYALGQLGRLAEGERMVREALDAPGIGAETAAIVAGQLASLLWNLGRLDEAQEWFALAIGGLDGTSIAGANLRMNRSILLMQRGELTAAIADLEQAYATYDAADSAADRAEAQHNLGYAALLGGDLVRAMREMAAARTVVAVVSVENAAIGDMDMAEVLRDAGLVTEAERLLEGAAAVFADKRIPQARAEAEFHLARSLLRHDAQRAADVARDAARGFGRLGNELWQARAEAVALRAAFAAGAMDRSGRIVEGARTRVRATEVARVAELLRRGGMRSDAMALRLDHELWLARRGDATHRLPVVPASASLEVRLLAHEVRATRAGNAGRRAQARKHAAAGLDELARWRASFGSLDMQTSLAMHGNALLLSGLDAAVAARRADQVFEWSERARHLSNQVVPLRPPPDPELAADLAELRMLRADLAGRDWLADPRAAELSDRLRHRQWVATGAAGLEDRIDLVALQAGLDADTAVLAYVYSTAGLSCLVVTSSDARLVDLPEWSAVRTTLSGLRSDLDVSAAVRTGPMAAVVRRSLDARLADLSTALLSGALAAVDAHRLVLTTPGVLAGLPWGMLPGLAGRPFTLAGSVSRWAHGRGEVRAAATAGFAVGPRVARAQEEAQAAASVWSSASMLAEGEATVDAVTALGGRVDVLHVAAHGRHAVDNPLFSGLELADGVLFGYDIDRMPAVPPTVILSACEVGRSAVRWGEEAVGMTRAWLHAGARCVVAAPVVVADDDATELLGAMHAGLAVGRAPAVALAEAAAVTGIRAPFQCHGDGF
ncbi:CHAT domain-containing protein [Microbacterium fluvii]|uniref:CHAT domain-containing protein n=1 Tax=Microbacterium fluvii TaxID=415215 RepID=A0ABW2HAC3_9MICO|nr:CHAT domain-containing tetratricopeptide repeat protein [Microbacterium fluvii]MCU4671047.1 CHAT domain-containing tetratricopeptide repeat protein [Microbacterium fluvii]